jgi:hypothetical protein
MKSPQSKALGQEAEAGIKNQEARINAPMPCFHNCAPAKSALRALMTIISSLLLTPLVSCFCLLTAFLFLPSSCHLLLGSSFLVLASCSLLLAPCFLLLTPSRHPT